MRVVGINVVPGDLVLAATISYPVVLGIVLKSPLRGHINLEIPQYRKFCLGLPYFHMIEKITISDLSNYPKWFDWQKKWGNHFAFFNALREFVDPFNQWLSQISLPRLLTHDEEHLREFARKNL